MINTLLKFIKSGNPQVINYWTKMINIITVRTSIYESRYLDMSNMHSPIIDYMIRLLFNLNPERIIKINNDYDKYVELSSNTEIAKSYMNPVYQSKDQGNLLSPNIPSYVINISDAFPLQNWPMNKSWDEWKELQPLTIIYHDSLELITDINRMSLSFKAPCSCIIGTMDISLLFFKYIKYYEHCKNIGKQCDMIYFLKNFIVFFWFKDLRRIWLFNLLTAIILKKTSLDNVTINPDICNLGMIQDSIVDIRRLLKYMVTHNMTLNDFLSTNWLGDSGSIYKSMKEWTNKYTVPNLKQYTFLKFLIEIPYVQCCIILNNMMYGNEGTKLNKELIFMLNRYKDQRLCDNILNLQLRKIAKQRLDETLTIAKSNWFL